MKIKKKKKKKKKNHKNPQNESIQISLCFSHYKHHIGIKQIRLSTEIRLIFALGTKSVFLTFLLIPPQRSGHFRGRCIKFVRDGLPLHTQFIFFSNTISV